MRSVTRLKLLSFGLASSLMLAACVPLVAQFKPVNPGPAPSRSGTTFSVDVGLVRLLASVQDASGATIGDLNSNDFQVFDSGIPQSLSTFERNTSVPLSVAILIDTSGSTTMDLHFEADAVLRFIPTLLNAGNSQDAFALFSFNWRTNVESDFGRNYKRAERAIRALKNDGGTSLYDAIYLASGTLQEREGRHVEVIITDGGDTTSYKHFEDALSAAQRADVVIYPIVVVPVENSAGRNTGGEHALTTLAAHTGGRIFFPDSYDHLDQAFAAILRDLRTQYLLVYTPKNVPEQRGLFHPITVEVQRHGAHVRTRTGYYQP